MKIVLRHKTRFFLIATISLLTLACEKEYFPVPPPPPAAKVPLETTTLEAVYVTSTPTALSNAYWKSADYLRVPVSALNTNTFYSNGYLNMTGTYDGLSSFNNGADPKVLMKAAYDNSKVYIYIEWLDSDISPAFASALLKGPADSNPIKIDTTEGWTSQGNCDRVALAFNILNASSAAGTFIDKGCAASCHLNKMQPASGSVDIWSWDIANSDALGYAADLVTDATNGLSNDAGFSTSVSNKKVPGNPRSAPAYEWNGVEQAHTRPDGKAVTLDPGYYLLNKIPFVGNIARGDSIFHQTADGRGCWHCHGPNGNGIGPTDNATPFASIGFARKYSRTTMISTASADEHPGKPYFAAVPAGSYDDLFAFIRGLGSVPGTYLTVPSGSAADVWSVSNLTRTKIDVSKAHTLYQVILIRSLTTPNADDVQFASPEGTSLPFGIALMDADGKNHIGSLKQILTFKSKTP